MKKYIYILSLLLFTGCTIGDSTKIDLVQLNDSSTKYGVVLFRSIYFNNADPQSICDEKFDALERNFILISTRPMHATISHNPDFEIKNQFKYKRDSFADTPMVMPEYFYGVRMLPEGKYYFKYVWSTAGDRDYKETEKVNYFDVKAGEVTYIGDYYWMNSVKYDSNFKDALMSRTRSSVEIKLCDRFDEAKQFFQKYYSHVKLPIKKNLLKCCEAYKTN
ncbi:MAG: hypothetical protein K2P53_03250 [Rickettsiales bacterium]|jgi:hypothetical protein|nr:hypothetical protein [Rickettsiales bacterium]